MPTLKQITCSIELGSTNTKLKEYDRRYHDGHVETFVAVPEVQVPFHVHVQSAGYIAPGLAAFVFMDGQYQCNRNKLHLKIPDDNTPKESSQIDFRFRQKEEKTTTGQFVGREWTFAALDKDTADKSHHFNPKFVKNVGTIEVVIMRCKSEGERVDTPPLDMPRSKYKSAPNKSSMRKPDKAESSTHSALGAMVGLFDGANDDYPQGGYQGNPVGPGGFVNPMAAPGHHFDPAEGMYRPDGFQGAIPSPLRAQGLQYNMPIVDQTRGGSNDLRDDRSNIHHGNSPAAFTLHPRGVPDHNANPDAGPQQQLDGYYTMPQVVVNQFPENVREWPMAQAGFLQPQPNAQHPQQNHVPCPQPYPQPYFQQQGNVQPVNLPPNAYAPPYPVAPPLAQAQPLQIPTFDMQQPMGFAPNENQQQQLPRQVNSVRDLEVELQAALKAQESKRAEIDNLIEKSNRYDQNHYVSGGAQVEELGEKLQSARNAAKDISQRIFQIQQQIGSLAGVPGAHFMDIGRAGDWKKLGDSFQVNGQQIQARVGGQDHNVHHDRAHSRHNNAPGHLADWDSRSRTSHTPSRNKEQVPDHNQRSGGSKSQVNGFDNKDGNAGWGNDANKGDDKPKLAAGWTTSKKNDGPGGENSWDAPAADDKDKAGDGWGNKSVSKPQSRVSGSAHSSAKSHGSHGYIKPYFADWRGSSSPEDSTKVKKKKSIVIREPYEFPAEPLPTHPNGEGPDGAGLAVHAGRGAKYSHRCYRPEYIDTMAQPYAVFSFKYRTKAALEKILKRNIDADFSQLEKQAQIEQLLSLPKSQLVEQLVEMQLGNKSSGGSVGANSSHGKSRSLDWNKKNDDKSSTAGWGNQGKSVSTKTQAARGWAEETEKKSVANAWAEDKVDTGGDPSWNQGSGAAGLNW